MAMAKDDEREVLEPYELHYTDLISLSSSSLEDEGEIERLQEVIRSVMENLGPIGPGLIAITGVPHVSHLRNTLLPLASDLSLLQIDDRKRILKDHGLGSDVPLKNLDRCVSSYAMQLKYGEGQDSSNLCCGIPVDSDKRNLVEANCVASGNTSSIDNRFKDLSGCFRELGSCMMDLGLRLARICDRAIGVGELEQSLLESGTAKGRLIHYHSYLDSRIIKEYGSRKRSKQRISISKSESYPCRVKESFDKNGLMHRNGDDGKSCEKMCDLWQQWHYDYGTLTVLTSPMFIKRNCCLVENGEDNNAKFCRSECPSPSGHTYLQIFHPKKDNICIVKAPPESFVLQVGESADILSRRKLQSTLHSVSRPVELDNVSREMFVVFLHPAWNKVFDVSNYPMEQLMTNGQYLEKEERSQGVNKVVENFTRGIHEIIPPLQSRLKDGMTFAEFSRETTKQYYGGNGLQSNR